MAVLLFVNLTFSQSKQEQITKLIDTYTAYKTFNGSVLVAVNRAIIYKKDFGFANMEWDIPNAPNTKHRLGSISKQFTGLLILQLEEAGKIDLKAPITKYLSDYHKANGDIITTHHLLTHTSGLPNYTSFPGFFQNDNRDPYTPTEFIKTFSEMDLEFTPGEKFNYSNSTCFLLGDLIEKISGKSYEKNGDAFANSKYLNMSIPYAAGSLYSTVEDLYLWD
jgi:CubicO group peptidase (beta-lactamase class C family)